MAAPANNFALLLDLAKEGSSEKRRELLRQITDVFLADPPERSDRESMLFDEIVGAVAADLETQVRIELARKVAVSRRHFCLFAPALYGQVRQKNCSRKY